MPINLYMSFWSDNNRPKFGFFVLPFFGVVLFPNPTICGSCVVP